MHFSAVNQETSKDVSIATVCLHSATFWATFLRPCFYSSFNLCRVPHDSNEGETGAETELKCTACKAHFNIILPKKLHGLSPRANYTDRATAARQRSDCQLLGDRGCHVVSVTNPYGRVLGFLDMNRYFSISSSSSVVLTRLSGPRSKPTTFFSGTAGNRVRASGSVAKNSDH
jgi:hypothetical protein